MSTTEQIELARQVDDLRAEGAELAKLMSTLAEEDWQRRTTFKEWTIYDVIAHLHFSDHMGMTTIESGAAVTEGPEEEIKEWQAIMDYLVALPEKNADGVSLLKLDARAKELRAVRA